MTSGSAQLPPSGLVGLDPNWSRLVGAPDHRSDTRTWHLLDKPARPGAIARLTVLCVHGNPSWSYLWRSVLAEAPDDVRVIAVDQLDMGFSERTGVVRRLADRVEDLCLLTSALELDGPIVTVAHDWGGPISLGWAQQHRSQLAGVVLANTAVHQPEGSPAPTIIRAVRRRSMLRRITKDSTAFIRGAIEMSRPRLSADVAAGFLAPYRSADRRSAITTFVDDIPLDPSHPSAAALDAIADGLADFGADSPSGAVPTLLLWGPRDPVFSDLYLHDFEARLPHADVHRFVGASHFVPEDAPVAAALWAWLEPPSGPTPEAGAPTSQRRPTSERRLWDELAERRDDPGVAVVELTKTTRRSITWKALNERVMNLAAGMVVDGIAPGDRVALMIPPGVDLNVALYACWRMGSAVVLVDSGLGPKNMARALASAAPDHLIGIPKAIAAARAMRWPGRRIPVSRLPELEQRGATAPAPAPPDAGALAAIVFTSGSTGPSKGVRYRHHQLHAQRDALAELYAIDASDRLVAAFAPFALYGPALGIASVVPDMDVAKPGTLTASAFGDAVAEVDATLAFASPAALENVIATQTTLQPSHRQALTNVRLVLSAGAPITPSLLERTVELMPAAEAHTPYGMTEVLPVADISLTELRHRTGDGVCVGRPRAGVEVVIGPFAPSGNVSVDRTAEPGRVGEVIVRARHQKDSYDRLWFTEHRSSIDDGWHRTGDVGHVDDDGYLWIGGRLEHLITTVDGPVTPVGIEVAVNALPTVALAAAVGIGPVGTQVVAVVVELTSRTWRGHAADAALTMQVRAAVDAGTSTHGCPPVDIAAVLVAHRVPVDRRHNSKVDRTRVAVWADRVLSGGRIGRL